ncbi:MAG: hypothetical protein QOK16_4845 [Solirubrobacteraceae bacterium]|jgi:hypothetical protein|nr:hypothetical protein [Solirubrobacteraceae bacterium]
MTPDRARRHVAVLCLPLLTAGLLAACGSDGGNSAGARTTTTTSTTRAAVTTTPTAAAAKTTAAATTSAASLDGQSITSTTGAAQVCSNAMAPRTDLTSAGAPLPARGQAVLPRPFSESSPWNTPADGRAVDPRSAAWIGSASRRVAVVAAANQRSVSTAQRKARDLRLYVNTCAWTPAIVGAKGGEQVRLVCRQRNCGPVAKEVKTLRVAPGIEPFPEFDGWYSVIDQSAGVGYDMWRARRVGNVISYQFIKRWRLDGPGFSPPATEDPITAVGARGSGLPLFAGVIQPDELRQGRIEHALAISVPGAAQRIFVQPASVTNGNNVIGSLPEGARMRLKSAYRTRKLPGGANRRSAEAIITALRTYGAIVVDRSITPALYARRSSDYGGLLVGNELQGIRLSDLEVVQAGPLLRFPPLESTKEEVQG